MQCFILFNMFLIVHLFTFLSETFFMDALKNNTGLKTGHKF